MDWFPIFMAVITGVVILTISYFRHRERVTLITQGINPHHAQMPKYKNGSWSLLLGLFGIALGAAFILGGFIMDGRDNDLLFTGVIFLFGGLSVLGYWKLTEKDRELSRRMYQARIDSLQAESSYGRSADDFSNADDIKHVNDIKRVDGLQNEDSFDGNM